MNSSSQIRLEKINIPYEVGSGAIADTGNIFAYSATLDSLSLLGNVQNNEQISGATEVEPRDPPQVMYLSFLGTELGPVLHGSFKEFHVRYEIPLHATNETKYPHATAVFQHAGTQVKLASLAIDIFGSPVELTPEETKEVQRKSREWMKEHGPKFVIKST